MNFADAQRFKTDWNCLSTRHHQSKVLPQSVI